jgi:hypothetical protein
MPMLAFMPWLHLRDAVTGGGVRAFPFAPAGELPEGIKSSINVEIIRNVLSQYMLAPLRSIPVATVLALEGKPLGEELNEAERARLFEFGRYLAVAGMSTRRFAGGHLEDYTATGHYQVIVQAFNEPFTGSMTMTHRRKDGSSRVMLGYTDIRFWLPDYLVGQGAPQPDLPLLIALLELSLGQETWKEEAKAACDQYLLANSDSPDVSLNVLSIATYAALERVSQSSQKLGEAQAKLAELLAVAEGSPWTGHLRDQLGQEAVAGGVQFQDWLQKLYGLRGSVAHGRAPPSHGPWSQDEHLLAGSFAFPLVLKCLLSSKGLYPLTLEDVADILGLEGLLAAKPFFPAKTADEDEMEWRERCGWPRRMSDIAGAVLDLRLQRTLEQTYQQIEDRST